MSLGAADTSVCATYFVAGEDREADVFAPKASLCALMNRQRAPRKQQKRAGTLPRQPAWLYLN